jgi:hypothetical protein
LAIQDRFRLELTPAGLSASAIEKQNNLYDFPPLQPRVGVTVCTEHLSQLPMKKSAEHYPCGWPSRPQLCPNIQLTFRNQLRITNGTMLYVTDMSLVHPLTYRPEERDSNIALSQGCMIAGKLIPSGGNSLFYDLVTLFPTSLQGAYNVMRLLLNPKLVKVVNDGGGLFNGPNSVGLQISHDLVVRAENSVELIALIDAQKNMHSALDFIFSNVWTSRENESLHPGEKLAECTYLLLPFSLISSSFLVNYKFLHLFSLSLFLAYSVNLSASYHLRLHTRTLPAAHEKSNDPMLFLFQLFSLCFSHFYLSNLWMCLHN